MLKKKIWANFQRIVEDFTQKIFNMLSNIWVWDPGSEIRDPRSGIRDPRSGIRDPGSGKNLFRIPGSKRHRIPDPQHWSQPELEPQFGFAAPQSRSRLHNTDTNSRNPQHWLHLVTFKVWAAWLRISILNADPYPTWSEFLQSIRIQIPSSD